MKELLQRAIRWIPCRVLVMSVAAMCCAVVLMLTPSHAVQVYAEEGTVSSTVSDTKADAPEQEIKSENNQPEKKMTVSIQVDGQTCSVELSEGTVRDALDKAGVTLENADVCTPSAGARLSDGLRILVTRVTYKEEVVTQPVAYRTIRKNDATLNKGTTKVAQAGTEGVRTIVTRYTEINGVLVGETVVSDSVTTEPTDRIILVGTKVVYGKYHGMKIDIAPQTTEIDLATQAALIGNDARPGSTSWRATVHNDGTITDQFGNTVSYQTMVSGRATAYYAKPGAGTSTGRKASYGVVAVDPKIIPYGTKMFICSADGSVVYGYAIAGDTGGTLLKGTVLVDVYFNNYNQCVWFSSKNMNIYILK